MNKTLRTAMLGAAAMLCSSVSAQDWVATAPADLETGDVVVIADITSSTAMSNNNGTSSAPAATSITLSDDKTNITGDVDEKLQFVVTVSDGIYQFGVGDDFVYCTNTNNGVRIGTNTNNEFTIAVGGDNNANFLFNTATSRYIGVYNSQDWRCYGTINTNIKACQTVFFKKTASDPSDTRIATTVTINADGITNTNLFDGTAAGTLTATVAAGETVLDAAVTWTSANTDVATVNEAGVVTLVAAGTATITAEYAGDDSYKGSKASYQLTVTNFDPNAPGTIGNPYTVAQAIEAIDANEGITKVYATGIVSQIVTEYSSKYNNITFDISADGTTDGAQLRAYRCTKADGDDAPAVDDVQVGDVVVIYGDLTKYNDIYEFGQGNTLVSLQRNEDERTATELLFVDEENIVKEGNEGTTIELATAYIYDGTLEVEGQITWKSSNEEVATIDAQAGIINLLKEGTATITATFAGDDNYKGCTNSYNITVNAVAEPGEEADITYDIAGQFDVIDGVLTDGTVSFTGYGPDNFKKNTGYFMMGKNGAYINFPTYEKDVAKIVVTGNSGASASTVMNIYVGEDAVSEETVGSKGTNVYVIEDGYRTAGTQYTLKVTSSHNAQITKIEIFFVNDSPATAIATVKAAAANGAAYNLAGQRVAEGYKGLVIVNGKKQLVK